MNARRVSWIIGGLFALATIGCGYTTRGLYSDHIHTVAVPIFKNNNLRRGVEFELTEKVIQYIESRTPYKVVDESVADATIKGEISSFFKNPIGEDGFDNPRGGGLYMTLKVAWVDNRTGEIIGQQHGSANIRKHSTYVIDAAQSQATATKDVIEQMAEQVVTMLQSPWP